MQPRTFLTAVVFTSQKYLLQAVFFIVSTLIAAASSVTAFAGNLDSSYDINVLVIKYFHINQNTCYPNGSFNPGNCLADQRARTLDDEGKGLYQGHGPGYYWNYSSLTLAVQDQVDAWKTGAEEASTYLGKQNGTAREPALRYHLIYPKTDVQSIAEVPYILGANYVDYNKILGPAGYNVCDYVDNKGVREVWILKGFHKPEYNHSESRMGVSMNETFAEEANGGGPEPIIRCKHTYRVYTHTYDRSDLVLHGWGHQIERELEHVSRNGVGPELFSRFNIGCADNSILPCYPMDPTRLVTAETTGGFYGEYFYLNVDNRGTPDTSDDLITFTSPLMSGGSPVTSLTPTVLFPSTLTDWKTYGGGPLAGVSDYFGARWSGVIVAPATGDYVFKTFTDDGLRLTIQDINGLNKRTLIDKWAAYGGFNSEPVTLNAGQWYVVQMEYNERESGALAQLRWQSWDPQTRKSNPLVLPTTPKIARCGTVHTAPNSAADEKNNITPNSAGTDCMDWQPEGWGQPDYDVSCRTWGCGALWPPYDRNNYNYHEIIFNNAEHKYSIWHWAYMPGRNNNKKMSNGQQLRNWWDVHGDFDGVKTCNTTLLDSSDCIADLAITSFRENTNPVSAGGARLTYNISAINNGPKTVPDGRVKINLPSGSTYVPSGSTSPDCYASGLTVTCYLGKLAQGGTRNFVLNVNPPLANSIAATATTVLPGTFQDTVPENNSASASPSPAITSFSPSFGQRDTLVTVYGTNFVPGIGQTAVSLNGVDAPIMQVVSPEILFFLVPKNATTGKIKVTTSYAPAAESTTDFIVSCTLSNPITQVLTLGTGTGPTNEEIQVTFTGHIANAAALTANPPTTGVLYICPGTTVSYAVTATNGSLSCQRNNNRTAPTGSLRVNDNLVCNNITGGGGDVDKFFVRSQY